MHSNRYTIFFALAVCVTCSLLLAFAAESLKPAIQQNMTLDVQKNILKATGLLEDYHPSDSSEMQNLYSEYIVEKVIDSKGQIVQDKTPEQIDPKIDMDLLPVYERVGNNTVIAYCLPVSGKGLWSTIYGYMALEPDASTIKGVTFYKHGETPGLGGEIEKQWFMGNFKGKRIFNEKGELVSITILKGKVLPGLSEEEQSHVVDGVSGATLTGNGINLFLEEELERYLPYLQQVRNSGI